MNGDTVKAIRLSRNMTQPEFAAAVKVSQSLVWAVENGQRSVSDSLRIKIAQTFGTGDDIVEAIARAKESSKLAL